MQYLYAYVNDTGDVRPSNQDSLAIMKAQTESGEVLLAVVCDGMGGYKDGELASKFCVDMFRDWFLEQAPAITDTEEMAKVLKQSWKELVEDINDRLVFYSQESGGNAGTTLTAALLYEGNYYIVQVGDSRAYLVNEYVSQITRDQSLTALKVREGLISEEMAKNDKDSHVLTECIGITWSVNPDFYCGRIDEGNGIVVCSDGFWHRIEERELDGNLNNAMIRDPETVEITLEKLMRLGRERGEDDNMTAVAVFLVPGDPEENHTKELVLENGKEEGLNQFIINCNLCVTHTDAELKRLE